MVFRYSFLALSALFLALNTYGAGRNNEVEVPRTAYKDPFKYYILSNTKQATIQQVTIKRLSYDTILYIKVEINCASRILREMGHNINSAKAISTNAPTQWYQPTIGSAQADIVTYICR
ncbi:hypothetical protein [Sulfurospirillum barnesii]|uniref:Uncharacterized protein n=1 Tax=Sulfurospirillum barnesii (strain ATCC 700032 / DSM 10660 / SES-3) TaxID=760154 RepID=I3XUQ4_SULBS|nr:hypothetical protein [Sulfurospirillum barnesii]AFL67678.1 hypothetical protein Sulba_0354 [Sulfurospirillum barnesii SES-3]